MLLNYLFYYLISRRDLLVKLNIVNLNKIPKIHHISFGCISKIIGKHNSAIKDIVFSDYSVFEYLFDNSIKLKKIKEKNEVRIGKKLKKVFNLRFESTLQKMNIYKFIFKLNIFMTNDQRNSSYISDLNEYNMFLKIKDKKILGKKSFLSVVSEYSKEISRCVVFKKSRLLNNRLLTRWDNFNFFINLPLNLSYLDYSDIIMDDKKKFYLEFGGNSFNSLRSCFLLFSSLRIIEYFRMIDKKISK